MIGLRAFAAAAAVLAATTALGAEGTYGPFSLDPARTGVAYLDGEIVEHTADDFTAMMEDHPEIVLLVLNSPGGLTEEARVIAETAYALGMDTFIPRRAGCYSACSTIFFAGEQRVAVGELGVHRSKSDEPFDDAEIIGLLLGFTLESWMHFGVPIEAILATYRTKSQEIYIFTPAEVEDFGINRGTVATLPGMEGNPIRRMPAIAH